MGLEAEIQFHAVEETLSCQLPSKATGAGGMMLSSRRGTCKLSLQVRGYVL